MAKNQDKRCPQCGGQIDYFGSCRKCGREWSERLELDEQAAGKPEGEQHDAYVKDQRGKKPTRNRNTKNPKRSRKAPRLPEKFAEWMIDPVRDSETEIITKRSLMRLDSRRAYVALGLSVQAYDAQKRALLCLSRLEDVLDEEDRQTISPTIGLLKRAFADLDIVRRVKTVEMAEMEMALEKAHSAARKARLRLLAKEAKKSKERIDAVQGVGGPQGPGRPPGLGHVVPILTGQDTEGFSTPEPAVIPSADLLEKAKERLMGIDKEKLARKKRSDPEGGL
jgi:hypothetical protein